MSTKSDSSKWSAEDWTQKFKEILILNGVTEKVSKVLVEDSGLRGENLTSQPHYVTIYFEGEQSKPLHLFVKGAISNSSHTEMVEDMRLFKKESVLFLSYIPGIREFCQKLGREELLDFYPKCYYANDQITVFENLVLARGYELLDKEELQDFDTAKIALINLAKHNAISYAFIKEVGGPERFFQMFPNLDFETYAQKSSKAMIEPWLTDGIQMNITMLEKCDSSIVKERDETIKKLQDLSHNACDLIWGPLKINPEDEKLLLLNHGDFWNNNMLFLRDKETNKLIHQITVDFQITRYSTPSPDLSYYFYTSLKPDMRRKRFKDLLTIYLNALKETTRELGHEIEISYEDLFADFRRKFQFGFWFGFFASNEAAYAVRKYFNLNDIPDISQYSAYVNNLITKWLQESPDRCNRIGKQIVELMKEYDDLKT